MLSILSLVVPVLLAPSLPQVGLSSLAGDEPPVRLWLNGDRRFEAGDRARVQVEARDDGFLLVLNFDTDGRVRVLYPVDPRDDGFVRGGRRYEVRDPRDRESFVVGREGSGFVYVALSPDPWNLRNWSRGSGWDYDRIVVDYNSQDPERDLTGLLEQIAGSRGFDYDLVEYFVHDVEIVRYEYNTPRYYAPGVWAGDPWCDPYWSTGWFCSARPGVVISYGRYYSGGWWSAGYGPSWYWPSSTWYRYRPYSYGRGYYDYSYHRPWVWSGPTYRPNNRPIIVGRSRDYTVGRMSPWTFASGADYASPSRRPNADLPDNYRPRDGGVRSRPVDGQERAPEARQGRPVTDRSASPPAAGRARPTTERTGGAGQPAARPAAGRRAGGDAAPAARPAPARQPAAQPRARSRGNDPESGGTAAATRVTTPSRATAPTQGSRTSEASRPAATRARPVEARPVARPATRQASTPTRAPAQVSRPAAQRPPESRPAPSRAAPQQSREARPAPSRPTAQAAPPPRAQSRQAPARASSPPAAAPTRRDPPARSRGNN
jgi:hypothetical protein